jgi:hypothetical protein
MISIVESLANGQLTSSTATIFGIFTSITWKPFSTAQSMYLLVTSVFTFVVSVYTARDCSSTYKPSIVEFSPPSDRIRVVSKIWRVVEDYQKRIPVHKIRSDMISVVHIL